MLSNVENSIFLNSPEVNLLPIVSAEWNQNLFNPPYITVAGNGIKETVTASATYTNVTGSNKHPDFVTKSFALSSNAGSASYSINTANNLSAYKIVFYARSSVYTPIMLNANAKGNSNQYGSSSVEINSYGWTKIEVLMGGTSSSDAIDTIAFKIVCNTFTNYETPATVYFTVPEVYENQYFNYQYNSLWPTDAPFSHFRPGESYITTGNSDIPSPSNFRKVTSGAKNGFTGDIFAPVSCILENPQYLFVTQYNPFIKNTLPTDISPYKYFVSESSSNPAISALYSKVISTNKIVLKFNTAVAVPNISISLNGYTNSTIYSGAVPSNGVELEQCLSELKRREYIPSYGIGLDEADRILYIGWSAHVVALTELYDSLLVRWKLNLAGKKSRQSVTSENFNECLVNNFRGGRRVIMKMLIQRAEIWRNGSQVDKGEGVNRFELQKAGKYNSERAFRESLQDIRKELGEYHDTKVEIRSDATNHYLLKITF